jgi:hypothetical protein
VVYENTASTLLDRKWLAGGYQLGLHLLNDWCPTNAPVECWNGNIELFGNSAGGNLVYEAAGRMYEDSPTNPYQVQAIGAWSGAPRMDELEDGHWPCAPFETKKSESSASQAEAAASPPV